MVKCTKCSKIINKKSPGVQCNKCSKWYHGPCASLTVEQLSELSVADAEWKCRDCNNGGARSKRISVILPDTEEEESDVETISASTQGQLLYDIRQELREMRKTVRDIIREELQSTLQFYSKKIDDYESKMHEYENRIKLMDNQLKNVSNASKNIQLKYDVMEQKVNKLEQAQICNKIEICGIDEKEQDVRKIAEKCAVLLQQKMDCITNVYRKNIATRSGTARAARAAADAPIIVSLREGCSTIWLQAARNVDICSSDLGLQGGTKIYLRASLSPTTAFLLWKAKSDLKDKSLCKFIWCKDGVIMVRKNEGDKKIYYVRSAGDIETIKKELIK